MRSLTAIEMSWVSGGAEVTATAGTKGASVTVKSDTGSFGKDLIAVYEGLVEATSHVIERVASVFKDE